MTQERRNPLPVGRYWIDISKEPVPLGTWQGFLAASRGFVHVETTEDDPHFSFFIFTTSKALVWPEGIGFPTIATPDIKSRSDTVQEPDPEPNIIDQIPTAGQVFKGVSNAVTLLVVAATVVLLLNLANRRRGKN